MAKKNRQNPPKPKEFHVDPFGVLKGVAVPVAAPKPSPRPVAPPSPEIVENGLNLFLQAVAGVTPLNHPEQKASQEARSAHKRGPKLPSVTPVVDESAKNLFIEEIGRLKLDTTFADSVPDDGELQPLGGNRLRQVKRGVVSVEYQLDLHGLTREEALEALPRFVRSARQKGQKAALIITGKGNHSAEEPVLQQAVASWLREGGREHVLEFGPAPRQMGGSGAYVVFLRPLGS